MDAVAIVAAGSPATSDTKNAIDTAPASSRIRISKIGGRFLVFDVADVARLRREQSMCSILVGLTPQAPNQTVFSSLPLELTADEVRWLVYDRDAAFVVDDLQEHLKNLASRASRRNYMASVTEQRRAAQAAADEMMAERERRGAEARAKMAAKRPEKKSRRAVVEEPRVDAVAHVNKLADKKEGQMVRVTPTTSAGLVGNGSSNDSCPSSDASLISRLSPTSHSTTALRAHLADEGYYTTPGLRFGGKLSVYPGDPFRYHAHFVATSYDWDEPICLLDIVGTGRLATGVKKGLLIGGAKPLDGDDDDDDDGDKPRLADNVRTFTMEWAAM